MRNRLQFTVRSSRLAWLKVTCLLAITVICQPLTVKSQDVHFTQFFTVPLILNPAHTGYYDGNYRIGFNFKAQWPWAISNSTYNYHTESPYVDFSFGEKKLKTGWMGIGFNFLNDEAGDGMLKYQRFGLSYAYHQAFDKAHRYVLSAGVGLNYVVRSVDFSKFYFNNQWVEEVGFDRTLNTSEPFKREGYSVADLSAGLNFGAQVHEHVKLDFGFSMLHINRPRNAFYETSERIGFRYQGMAGFEYKINEQITWDVNAYYGYEKKASEIMVGSMLGYGFMSRKKSEPEHVLYMGLYYRAKDALAPLVGYQYKKTRILLNYDLTLSKLAKAGRANGGPEISFVHVGGWSKEFNHHKVYCPQF